EKLGAVVTRGKVEIRVNYARTETRAMASLDPDYLSMLAAQLQTARRVIPDVPAPRLSELLNASSSAENASFDPEIWTAMCAEATTQALAELQAAREREGQRLAAIMSECAVAVSTIVDDVE